MTALSHHRTRALLLGTLLASSLPAWSAMDIKGARFNDNYQLGEHNLHLNGAGVRVKFIIDVYAAGLYVPQPAHDAGTLMAEGGAKSMQIVLLRELTGEDFAEAMVKGFTKNNSESDNLKYHAMLEEVRRMMMGFGAVKKGTTIRIDHWPGKGTRVLIDGVQKGPEIGDEGFYNALLRIWLGNAPVDADLKEALLGTN